MKRQVVIVYLSIVLSIAGLLFSPQIISSQETEQATQSKIEGTILNANDEPVAQAKVELKHSETGRTFKSESNKDGQFSFNFLPPGKYSYLVEKPGYQTSKGELELPPDTLKQLQIFLEQQETPEQKQEKEALLLFDEGVKLAEEKNFDQAIQAFQKAAELKPDFAEAHLNMGILYYQQQKDDEAEKALLKAHGLKPDEPKAKEILSDLYYEKAKTFVESNKTDEALEKLKQGYALNPNHATINYLLGVLYATREMKEEARLHLELFLKLEPKSPLADKARQILADLIKLNQENLKKRQAS